MGGDHGDHSADSSDEYVQPVYGHSKFKTFFDTLYNAVDIPVTWFREKIVESNRKTYPWYHQVFPRVTTIEKCEIYDIVCLYEANEQYLRDKKVDTEIMSILRHRVMDCVREEYPNHYPRCHQLREDLEEATANWFTKYGDMGVYHDVKTAFIKQKHRMLWERRHGPIGTGMKPDPYNVDSVHDE